METAKDILEKHGVRIFGAQQNRIVDAMKEIADRAWYDGYLTAANEASSGKPIIARHYTFMKELFPESIKDPLASG